MNLFEYEGKKLLSEEGITVPRGGVAHNPEEAVKISQEIGYPVAIKSQVTVGSRGKAGGIKFAASPEEVRSISERLLGFTIQGQEVNSLLVEEKLNIVREFYMSVTIEPEIGAPVLMASATGGVDIEIMAAEHPEQINKEPIDIWRGLRGYQVRRVLKGWGLDEAQLSTGVDVALRLYSVFRKYDCELAEINPLVLTEEGKIVAADAKFIINDNALYRQPFKRARDRYTNELEYQASQHNLNYVKLDGNIGVICTGAGLTMATIDLIKKYGGAAANFLESGGANYQNAYHGLSIVLSDPAVKILLINTFGLVSRSDVICRGIANVLKELKPNIPIVASIRGTGEEEARRIFREELGIEPYIDTEEAVKVAVLLARR